MKHLLSLALAGALCAQALAQSSDTVPFPAGPVLAKAPNFAKWTMTITSTPKATAGSSAGSPSTETKATTQAIVTTTKTFPIRLVVTSDAKRGTSTIWCVGSSEVIQNQQFQKPFVSTSGNQGFVDFSHCDFPELEWITEANYVGLEKSGEGQALLFRTKIVLHGRGQTASDHIEIDIPCEAKIDAQTRLPMSFQKGDEMFTYKFDQVPTSILSLPPDIKSILDQEQSRLKRLARVPPHG